MTQARHLYPVTLIRSLLTRDEHSRGLAQRRCPNPDRGALVRDAGRHRAIDTEHRDRNLESDRVDVEALQAVDARSGWGRNQVQVLKRPQVAEIEDGAQVDKEWIGALAGEDHFAGGQRLYRGGR